MPTARFQANFNRATIDANTGVITGVKIMQLGKVSSFEGPDGKPKQVKIADAHIKRLLTFAGNRAIVAHLTHEWFDSQSKENADSVEMGARIGAFKNFRKDESGDLIADLHLKPGQEREQILWGAENNPEDNMVSVVFSYDKNDPQCMPLDFRAADLVPLGAATTALFKETTNDNMPITIDDLKTLLSDPEAKAMIQGCLDGHTDAEEAKMEDETAAEMEKDGEVTDEDKKKEDEQKPALMRACIRVTRALARKSKSLAVDETAILAKAKVQSEAAATALLGKGGYIKQDAGKQDETAVARFNGAVKELTDRGVKSGVATQTVMREKPELLKAMQIEQGIFKK